MWRSGDNLSYDYVKKNMLKIMPGVGFELGTSAYEACILPLHQRAMGFPRSIKIPFIVTVPIQGVSEVFDLFFQNGGAFLKIFCVIFFYIRKRKKITASFFQLSLIPE